MKRFILDFLHRGLVACGFGPIVLAIIYMILQQTAAVETIETSQVYTGIFSITALAFIAGGMNAVYKIEQMPLILAILAHGGVLYISYLSTYIINGWLNHGVMHILVFSAIFIIGYLVIWVIIYSITKQNTKKINEKMRQKQLTTETE